MRSCTDHCKDQNGNCPILASDSLPAQCVGRWVLDKYYFLERYLGTTRSARRKFSENNNSVFIDLFAGPGKCIIRYQDEEIDNGGLRTLRKQSVPFNEYYFFDICRENVLALHKRIGNLSSCHIERCNSNEIAANLVEKLLSQDYRYHFIYIDPFGPEGLKFTTIREFAKLKRVDLLIHFPIGAIRRNLPKWQEADLTILDEVLGTNEWRKKLEVIRSGQTLGVLLSLYRSQLNHIGFPDDGLRMARSDAAIFSDLPVVSIRNTKDVELYVLILASKHPIAQRIWNKVIKTSPDGQTSLF